MIAVLTAVIETLWFLPLVLRQGKKDAVPKRYTVFAALLGGTIGLILAVVLGLGSKINNLLGLNNEAGLGLLIDCLFNAGIAEELAKFLCGWLMIKIAKPVRKLDYILILGAAGAGFAATESFMYASSAAIAFLRCLFPLHLMWQMIMGEYYYDLLQAKKTGNSSAVIKAALLGFGFPVLMHTVSDIIVIGIPNYLQGIDADAFTAFDICLAIFALVWILFTIAFCIWEEVRVVRYVRQSRLADVADKLSGTDAEGPGETSIKE